MKSKRQGWIDVDPEGLSKLMAGRPKSFVLHELLQNSWDQNVTHVDVSISYSSETRKMVVRVEDDDPDGFRDIKDSYTMFAESYKKDDPSKRGRFNIGEKLVLAISDSASVVTTTGKGSYSKMQWILLMAGKIADSVWAKRLRLARALEYAQEKSRAADPGR